jgi:hypothetical protein
MPRKVLGERCEIHTFANTIRLGALRRTEKPATTSAAHMSRTKFGLFAFALEIERHGSANEVL